MHISEGVLKPEILIVTAVISAVAVVYAFWTLKNEDIPKVSAFSALFFLASFIHIPIGVTSAHLLLSGLVGVVLGMRAYVAIFVALFLQGLLFGFGGVTTLGVNLFVLATSAFTGFLIFCIPCKKMWQKNILWFCVGFFPIAFGAFLLSFLLAINGEEFFTAAKIAFLAHIPIMFIEGAITLFALRFIEKLNPLFLKEKR